MMLFRTISLSLALFLLLYSAAAQAADLNERASPASAKLNRERGLDMLSQIKAKIEQEYYDKNYRG